MPAGYRLLCSFHLTNHAINRTLRHHYCLRVLGGAPNKATSCGIVATQDSGNKGHTATSEHQPFPRGNDGTQPLQPVHNNLAYLEAATTSLWHEHTQCQSGSNVACRPGYSCLFFVVYTQQNNSHLTPLRLAFFARLVYRARHTLSQTFASEKY